VSAGDLTVSIVRFTGSVVRRQVNLHFRLSNTQLTLASIQI